MGPPLAIPPIAVATPCIDIIYAAHTASCTFLLDSEGICRRIVMAPKGKRRDSSRTASRCVGAQYVASLDHSAAGGLVEMPRVGAAMLFARVDERGRVSLVRTSVVTSFESNASEDPFRDSGTVETSAPIIDTPRAATERSQYRRPAKTDEQAAADYYDDPSDRTQRIQAVRAEEIDSALDQIAAEHINEQNNEFATAEYEAVEEEPPAARTTLPSHVSTLRNPRQSAINDDDDEADEYARATLARPPPSAAAPIPTASPSRGMLPRRSDPLLRAAASQGWTPAPAGHAPRAYDSDVQVRRRR